MRTSIPVLTVFAVLLCSFTERAQSQDPEILVPINFNGNFGNSGDISWGIGLDSMADDGVDDFEAQFLSIPAGPANVDLAEFEVGDQDTRVFRDIRKNVAAATDHTYELVLFYGQSAGPANIEMTWTAADFQAGSAFAQAGFTTAEIRDQAGNSIEDLDTPDATPGSHIFTGSSFETQRYRIVLLAEGETNASPVARADKGVAFVGETDVELCVLDNDFDPENDTLTISSVQGTTDQNGTAAISSDNLKILYTPPASLPAVPDTFTYTVSDGQNTSTPATVTVELFGGQVSARRTNQVPLELRLGAGAGDGLTINIRMDYPTTPTALQLEEELPTFDSFDGAYQIAAGTHSSGLDLSGPNPPDEVFGVLDDVDQEAYVPGTSTEVIFRWNTIPTTPIEFSYRLIGTSETEVNPKTLHGTVSYTVDGTDGTSQLADTTFTPTFQQFHDADFDHNWQIGVVEVLRVVELYNNNQFYTIDSKAPADAGYIEGFIPSNSDPGTLSRFHTADFNMNGQVGVVEVLRAVELYNNNRFYDKHPGTPADADWVEGFIPSDTLPTR